METAYRLDSEWMDRAHRTARKYPDLVEIRTEAQTARAGMARVMTAEHNNNNGWADAARAEYNAQGMRHDTAEKAAVILALLRDGGGITTDHDRHTLEAVDLLALEIRAAVGHTLAAAPYYRLAADNIPDCPTPYAHNLAHSAE